MIRKIIFILLVFISTTSLGVDAANATETTNPKTCQIELQSPLQLKIEGLFDRLMFPIRVVNVLRSDFYTSELKVWASPLIRSFARSNGVRLESLNSRKASERGLALLALIGKALNEKGDSPIQFLRTTWANQPLLMELISNLEAEAQDRSLKIVWQDQETSSSELKGDEIAIYLDHRFAAKLKGVAVFLAIAHELGHRSEITVPPSLPGRATSINQYVEMGLPALLQDEVDAHLKEYRAYQNLIRAGLRVKLSSLPDLAQTIFPLFEKGSTNQALVNAVDNAGYGLLYTMRLCDVWKADYERADLDYIKNLRKGSSLQRSDVTSALQSSMLREKLAPENKLKYDERIFKRALPKRES